MRHDDEYRNIETPTGHVRRIAVPKPPIGSKSHLVLEKGTFILEEQPGNILHITCAHAGSGFIKVYDGKVVGPHIIGRLILQGTPAAMGVWHLNAGFQHGLVIDVGGGTGGIDAMFTAVWQTRPEATKRLFTEKRDAMCHIERGRQVLTEHDAILYSVLLTNPGSGYLTVRNGKGRDLFRMPSSFPGSFLLEHVFAEGGLVLDVDFSVPPSLALSWLEEDHVAIPTEGASNERHPEPSPAGAAGAPDPAPGTAAAVAGAAGATSSSTASPSGDGPLRLGDGRSVRPSGSEARGAAGRDVGPEPAGSPARGRGKPRR